MQINMGGYICLHMCDVASVSLYRYVCVYVCMYGCMYAWYTCMSLVGVIWILLSDDLYYTDPFANSFTPIATLDLALALTMLSRYCHHHLHRTCLSTYIHVVCCEWRSNSSLNNYWIQYWRWVLHHQHGVVCIIDYPINLRLWQTALFIGTCDLIAITRWLILHTTRNMKAGTQAHTQSPKQQLHKTKYRGAL